MNVFYVLFTGVLLGHWFEWTICTGIPRGVLSWNWIQTWNILTTIYHHDNHDTALNFKVPEFWFETSRFTIVLSLLCGVDHLTSFRLPGMDGKESCYESWGTALCVQMLAKGMVSAVLHFRSQGLESWNNRQHGIPNTCMFGMFVWVWIESICEVCVTSCS